MKNIIDKFKEMTLFQKIQVISGIIPLYSFLLVAITSYIIKWKFKKGGWVMYCIIGTVYFCVISITWNSGLHFAVKYLITFPVSIIGNYLFVSQQMK